MQGEGAHYVFCTPRELDDIVDLDKQSLRKKRKETKDVYRLGGHNNSSRRLHSFSHLSPLINDDVNARGEIKDVVRAAKYRQERKNVQDSLLFATGKRQLRRACGDISILRTTENGSQPIEDPESYNDMYGGFAGRSATATEEEKIKRRFLRSRDRWMTLMDCGHKSTSKTEAISSSNALGSRPACLSDTQEMERVFKLATTCSACSHEFICRVHSDMLRVDLKCREVKKSTIQQV